MDIKFVCACGKRLLVPMGRVGAELKCPRCGETNRVPEPGAASVLSLHCLCGAELLPTADACDLCGRAAKPTAAAPVHRARKKKKPRKRALVAAAAIPPQRQPQPVVVPVPTPRVGGAARFLYALMMVVPLLGAAAFIGYEEGREAATPDTAGRDNMNKAPGSNGQTVPIDDNDVTQTQPGSGSN